MKHLPSYTYTPLDVERLLCIGFNTIHADGVLVFDNLDPQEFNLVGPPPFVKMLVKLKLDILVVCTDGELHYMLNSSRPVSLLPGEIAFFRQDQIVEFNEKGGSARIIMIAIANELTIGIRGIENIGISHDTVLYSPSVNALKRITDVYKQLRSAICEDSHSYKKEITHSYARILLMYLSDIVEEERLKTKGPAEKIYARRDTMIFNEFTRKVKEQYRQHRDVRHYATQIHITPEHLSRIVKTVSGKTASQWIKDYVVLEAKVLLKSSDMTVYQISEDLNFPNPSFFAKFFRKSTGMTPGTYRHTD